ncbi:ribbon-helix-helix domain-containing protein [Gluconobacter roseus]|uniref:ribbon-helix-helix domain-containing protein n=1 Tax=Gluconobacter roseus TaxID=586239 RepID=UPI0038D0D69D
MSDLIKRSLSLSGHRTSVALEPEFWAVLDTMAATRQQSFASLVASLDATRDPERPLASALRVAALMHLQKSIRASD